MIQDTMGDDELLTYFGVGVDLPPTPENAGRRADLAASLRHRYAALITIMRHIEAWDQGRGPLPEGVIVYKPRRKR